MAELAPVARAARLAVVLTFLLASLTSGRAQPVRVDQPTQPAVLVLAADDFTRPYLRLIFEGFSSVVTSGSSAPAIYFESIDITRFEEPHYRELSRDWLSRRYKGRRIDLVVPLGEDALGFLIPPTVSPWPGARVLFLEAGSVKFDLPRELPVAGGMLLDDLNDAVVATVKTVLPATSHIALLYGSPDIERARWVSFREAVRRAGLEPIDLLVSAVDDVKSQIARLPPKTVVFILAPTVDARGHVLSPAETCRVVSNAERPAFTLATHDLGCGVVGGLMRDWGIAGRLLGMEALARLQRPSNEVIQVPLRKYTTLAFDDRQLARWRIPESRLPAGAEIRFREPSLWRDHRSAVIATAAFTLVQSVLIGGLVWERRRRRRAEVESRRNLTGIAHLDRRAAMGELATSLAHELHQPLNAILQNVGVAQMMLQTHPLPPALTELSEIINDIGRDDVRASEVIRRMRDLLRKQDLETQPVNLAELASEAVSLVHADATARGVVIESEFSSAVPSILGDRIHLQQVILNLLLNAMDAVGGLAAERRRVGIALASDEGEARLTVSDSGIGIHEGQLEAIFEAFYTTKAGGGMGMGLAIVRGIVDAHGGRVGASNNATVGASVWFAVPHAAIGRDAEATPDEGAIPV